MARSTVIGLDEFKRHMQGLQGSYALIGGIACDILLSEADLPFRATHDFDTVLVADGRLPETAKAIWSLVIDGGYRCGWGRDENVCFYRFTDPAQASYPRMIEVFSKTPDFLEGHEGIEIAPLHIDDQVSSLSAIMLDNAYYDFMLNGIVTVDGISVLNALHLIPFKAKAYLDLQSRKELGEQLDSKKIKKHKRDALRLAQLLSGNEAVSLQEPIVLDMRAFISDCEASPVNLKQIGITGASMDDILATLKRIYGNAS